MTEQTVVAAGAAAVAPVSTSEVRLLEGPNLYFTRPAVKVSLHLPGWVGAESERMTAACRAVGLDRVQPGVPGSGQRQRVVVRVVERVVRALAAAAGTRRLGVRTRPGGSVDEVVCAFVWRHRARARALAESLGPALADVLCGTALGGRALGVRRRRPGGHRW